MKKIPFLILILLLLCTTFAATFAAEPQSSQSSQTLKYRMIPTGGDLWMDPSDKARTEVRRQIDLMVSQGYNAISLGPFTFMPMHFVDYARSPYPEAAQYTSEKVASNLATVRDNIRYAKQKGIKYVAFRSYSFYAPYNFWKAHQKELNPNGVFDKLLMRAHQNDMYQKALDGKSPYCVPQQQWTNATFRNFFLWSTEKVLDLIPELDGFLNAYAEAAWTYDIDKVADGKWSSWKDCVDREATDSCFVDYSNRLAEMLQRKRGDDYFFGLRDWYVKPELLASLTVPRDKLVIAVKYSGFDQPLVNYPPWGKDLLDQGFSVIFDIQIYNAEWPSPLYWYNREIVNKIYENIREAHFTGVGYHDFDVSNDSFDNPIRQLTIKTAAAAMNGAPLSEKDALAELAKNYGKAAPAVLASLEAVGWAQEAYIKLMPAWFWRGDGLTPGGLQLPRLWMALDNPEAPDRMGFVRQDAVGIPEYVAAFLDGPDALKTAEARWKGEGRKTPLEMINFMDSCADRAVEQILAARKLAPKSPYMRDMVASAFIHRQVVSRDNAFLRSAMDIYKSGYVFDDKNNPERKKVRQTGYDLTQESAREMQNMIASDQLMRALLKEFAPRRPDMRGEITYETERKDASAMGIKLTVPELDKAKLEEIRSIIKQ